MIMTTPNLETSLIQMQMEKCGVAQVTHSDTRLHFNVQRAIQKSSSLENAAFEVVIFVL